MRCLRVENFLPLLWFPLDSMTDSDSMWLDPMRDVCSSTANMGLLMVPGLQAYSMRSEHLARVRRLMSPHFTSWIVYTRIAAPKARVCASVVLIFRDLSSAILPSSWSMLVLSFDHPKIWSRVLRATGCFGEWVVYKNTVRMSIVTLLTYVDYRKWWFSCMAIAWWYAALTNMAVYYGAASNVTQPWQPPDSQRRKLGSRKLLKGDTLADYYCVV